MGPKLVISDKRGRIFTHPHLEAAGMAAGNLFRLEEAKLIKLPPGSELFMLPSRNAVGFDPGKNDFDKIETKGLFCAAAFLAPGYTVTLDSAYEEGDGPRLLPLFSYAAVAFYKNAFYTAAVRVDKDIRHDSRFINIDSVKKGISDLRKTLPKNRLVRHLETCALDYGCPNAQNFFLHRFEAPLPTSPRCNAACAGCISYQPDKSCAETQPRIKFIPEPEEVAEIAIFHIKKTKDPIVSFGQGCEGEPLLAGGVLERSIKLIRASTDKGTININTNASRSQTIAKLFDAGLDSIRVSLNSSRKEYYLKYYKPKGYSFDDVMSSVKIAKNKGGFVSINYLTMPGFTDSKGEFDAFRKFVRRYSPDMIQWRNLNFDPIRYFEILGVSVNREEVLGVGNIIKSLKKEFPRLRMGYFNPSVSH